MHQELRESLQIDFIQLQSILLLVQKRIKKQHDTFCISRRRLKEERSKIKQGNKVRQTPLCVVSRYSGTRSLTSKSDVYVHLGPRESTRHENTRWGARDQPPYPEEMFDARIRKTIKAGRSRSACVQQPRFLPPISIHLPQFSVKQTPQGWNEQVQNDWLASAKAQFPGSSTTIVPARNCNSAILSVTGSVRAYRKAVELRPAWHKLNILSSGTTGTTLGTTPSAACV